MVVFEQATSGAHAEDLYATTRTANGWSEAVNLTAASPHGCNHDPAFSPDGSRVTFDCGEDQYGDTRAPTRAA
jgi:hypothetical protein